MTEKRRRDEPQSGLPNGGPASNVKRALKSIVTVQIGEAELERLLGLLEFVVVGHRTGGIEHEGHILRHRLALHIETR